MCKRILCIMLCLTLLLSSVPALAAVKVGRHVQLVVDGELLDLTSRTGYVSMDGSKTYIPIATVAEALGYRVSFNGKKTGVAITTDDGDVVKAVRGYHMITVNDKKVRLKASAILHNGVLLVHTDVLKYLDAGMATYPLSTQLRRLGYSGPTMVINQKGRSLAPPVQRYLVNSFAADLEAAQTTTQIVAIQYSSGSSATFTYHEKVNGVWQQLLTSKAIVGVNGIGKSVEGDKKTPRGTYELTAAFGIKKDPGTAMPYTKLTKYHYWCSTSGSEYYNQMVDISQVDYKPTSADEYLRGATGYYNYALVVNYNKDCVDGKGSGIFLHSRGKKNTTGGCIAIPEDMMIQLLQMLKPGAKIVIF